MQRIKHATRETWSAAGILLMALAVFAHAPAIAQEPPPATPSEADAVDDHSEMSARLAELESRVETLLARIEHLESMLATRDTDDPKTVLSEKETLSTNAAVGIRRDAAVLHSPEIIAEMMRADFQDDLLRDPSFVLGIDSPNIRAQDEAARVLRNWMEKNTRSFKKPVSWSVRTLESDRRPDGDSQYVFNVIHPDGSSDSKTLKVVVPSRFERRIQGWRMKDGFKGLTLKGFVEPRLRLTPDDSEKDELKTMVVFEPETHIVLNEWIQVRFDFRLSSVTPRFETSETTKMDRKGDSTDEI